MLNISGSVETAVGGVVFLLCLCTAFLYIPLRKYKYPHQCGDMRLFHVLGHIAGAVFMFHEWAECFAKSDAIFLIVLQGIAWIVLLSELCTKIIRYFRHSTNLPPAPGTGELLVVAGLSLIFLVATVVLICCGILFDLQKRYADLADALIAFSMVIPLLVILLKTNWCVFSRAARVAVSAEVAVVLFFICASVVKATTADQRLVLTIEIPILALSFNAVFVMNWFFERRNFRRYKQNGASAGLAAPFLDEHAAINEDNGGNDTATDASMQTVGDGSPLHAADQIYRHADAQQHATRCYLREARKTLVKKMQQGGCEAVVSYLQTKHVSVTSLVEGKDEAGRNFLHHVAAMGMSNVLDVIALHYPPGLDGLVAMVDDSGLTPLHRAALGTCENAALQNQGKESDDIGRLPDACRGDIVSFLAAECRANVNAVVRHGDGRTALHLAVQTFDPKLELAKASVQPDAGVFKALLDNGAEQVVCKQTEAHPPLLMAHDITTHHVLFNGNANDKSPLMLAVEIDAWYRVQDILSRLDLESCLAEATPKGVPLGAQRTKSSPAEKRCLGRMMRKAVYCERCQHASILHVALCCGARVVSTHLLTSLQFFHTVQLWVREQTWAQKGHAGLNVFHCLAMSNSVILLPHLIRTIFGVKPGAVGRQDQFQGIGLRHLSPIDELIVVFASDQWKDITMPVFYGSSALPWSHAANSPDQSQVLFPVAPARPNSAIVAKRREAAVSLVHTRLQDVLSKRGTSRNSSTAGDHVLESFSTADALEQFYEAKAEEVRTLARLPDFNLLFPEVKRGGRFGLNSTDSCRIDTTKIRGSIKRCRRTALQPMAQEQSIDNVRLREWATEYSATLNKARTFCSATNFLVAMKLAKVGSASGEYAQCNTLLEANPSLSRVPDDATPVGLPRTPVLPLGRLELPRSIMGTPDNHTAAAGNASPAFHWTPATTTMSRTESAPTTGPTAGTTGSAGHFPTTPQIGREDEQMLEAARIRRVWRLIRTMLVAEAFEHGTKYTGGPRPHKPVEIAINRFNLDMVRALVFLDEFAKLRIESLGGNPDVGPSKEPEEDDAAAKAAEMFGGGGDGPELDDEGNIVGGFGTMLPGAPSIRVVAGPSISGADTLCETAIVAAVLKDARARAADAVKHVEQQFYRLNLSPSSTTSPAQHGLEPLA